MSSIQIILFFNSVIQWDHSRCLQKRLSFIQTLSLHTLSLKKPATSDLLVWLILGRPSNLSYWKHLEFSRMLLIFSAEWRPAWPQKNKQTRNKTKHWTFANLYTLYQKVWTDCAIPMPCCTQWCFYKVATFSTDWKQDNIIE